MELRKEIKERRRFHGRHLVFEDTKPRVYSHIKTDRALARKYVKKKNSVLEVDTQPKQSVNIVKTKSAQESSHGMTHEEGGWPAHIAEEVTIENTQRIRKRIVASEDFVKSVKAAAVKVNYCANQNIAIDIYEEYFDSEKGDDNLNKSETYLKEVCNLVDPSVKSRTVIDISWSKMDAERIVCAYCNPAFSSTASDENWQAYTWNLVNVNTPELELIPQSQIRSVKLRHNGQEVLSGLKNGTLSIFDIRNGSHPVSASSIDCSHEESVRQVDWLSAQGGFECVSISTDGNICFWDSRRLNSPIQKNLLRCPKISFNPPRGAIGGMPGGGARRGGGSLNRTLLKFLAPFSHKRISQYSGSILAGTCIAVPSTSTGRCDIIAGTETGLLLSCSGKTSSNSNSNARSSLFHSEENVDAGNNGHIGSNDRSPARSRSSMNGSAMVQEQMIDSLFIGHLSSVLSVSRNSCYPNIFLSTGDWSTRVWSTDLPCHIASTSYGAYQTTCAMWSPTKVDTFFVTNENGMLQAWNYGTMEEKCVYEKKVSSASTASLAMSYDGQNAAVGDTMGRTTILNVSSNLCQKSSQAEEEFLKTISRRISTVGAHARHARRQAETSQNSENFLSGNSDYYDIDLEVNVESGASQETKLDSTKPKETRMSKSLRSDIDNLMNSFNFEEIENEVDNFYVNLVKGNTRDT